MTSWSRLIAIAVLAGFLVLLPGCRDTSKTLGPTYVMLTYNSGTCEQNGSTGVIDVPKNQAVIFQGASIVSQFHIEFDRCPFASCPIDSPNGTPINAGPPNANAVGNTYHYTAMTVNKGQCTDIGPLGMRIWPP